MSNTEELDEKATFAFGCDPASYEPPDQEEHNPKIKKPKMKKVIFYKASEEIDELLDAITEKYRQDIGITPDDFAVIYKNRLNFSYFKNGDIFINDKITHRVLTNPCKHRFNQFQFELICKKTVSDLDKLAIEKFKETNDEEQTLAYLKTINIEKIWKKHAIRFCDSRCREYVLVNEWEALHDDTELPF